MTKTKLAVIGDGVVAGYAAAGGLDAGAEVTVYSLRGEPTMPPPGAFYLYALPPRMHDRWPHHIHHETVVGLDLKLYTQRMWGTHYPSSIDSLFDEIAQSKVSSRERLVWQPTPEMVRELFYGVTWQKIDAPMGVRDVLRLSGEYDLVAVAVPISFVDERPKVVQMPVLVLDPQAIQLTPLPIMRRSMAELARLMEGLGDHVTFYSADVAHPWLRATVTPQQASFELPPDALSPSWWRAYEPGNDDWILNWREFLREHTRNVPKLHPASTIRNVAPEDNVVLCGRWATWDRHELSYEAYNRIVLAVGELDMLERYSGG